MNNAKELPVPRRKKHAFAIVGWILLFAAAVVIGWNIFQIERQISSFQFDIDHFDSNFARIEQMEKELAVAHESIFLDEARNRANRDSVKRAIYRTRQRADFPVTSGNEVVSWGYLPVPYNEWNEVFTPETIGFRIFAYFPPGKHKIDYSINELTEAEHGLLNSRISIANQRRLGQWNEAKEAAIQKLKTTLPMTLDGGQVYEFVFMIRPEDIGTPGPNEKNSVSNPVAATLRVFGKDNELVCQHELPIENTPKAAGYDVVALNKNQDGVFTTDDLLRNVGMRWVGIFPIAFRLPNELAQDRAFQEWRFQTEVPLMRTMNFWLFAHDKTKKALRVELVNKRDGDLQINPVSLAGNYSLFLPRLRDTRAFNDQFYDHLMIPVRDKNNAIVKGHYKGMRVKHAESTPLSEFIQPYDGSGIYFMRYNDGD